MTNLHQSGAIISFVFAAMGAALMAAAASSASVSHRFASSSSCSVSGCERLGPVSSFFELFSSVFVLATFDCNYPEKIENKEWKINWMAKSSKVLKLTRFHACSGHNGSSWLMSNTGTRHCELSENFAVHG